jgi:hypothetical protein
VGIETDELDPSGPFTRDEAIYIEQRGRLREVLRSAGTLHLLQPEYWVNEDGTPYEQPQENNFRSPQEPVTNTPESRGRTPQPTSSQADGPNADAGSGAQGDGSDGTAPEPFVAVDRSKWTNDALEAEIEERNEKILAFNEDIEDESEHWALLPSGKGKVKDELLGILAQHDRFIYDTKAAPGGDSTGTDADSAAE